jgi:predicted dehydrogenase
MKVLIAGCGSIGRRHALNAAALGAEVVLCDPLGARLEAFARQHGFTQCYTDLPTALAQARPAAAVVASPTHCHLEQALQLAERGVHILMEKPLSHTLTGLETLERVVAERKLTFMMAQCQRFHEGFLALKRVLDEKRIGKVWHVEISNGWYLPDWHYQEDYRKEYAAQKSMGGGVLLTNLSHLFDTIHWLFGAITECTGWKGRLSDLALDVEDYTSCLLRTADGTCVSLVDNFLERAPHGLLRISGAEGALLFNLRQNSIAVWTVKDRRFLPGDARAQEPGRTLVRVLEQGIQYDMQPEVIQVPFETNHRYRAEMAHFFDLVSRGATHFDLDIQAGLRVMRQLLSPQIKWLAAEGKG